MKNSNKYKSSQETHKGDQSYVQAWYYDPEQRWIVKDFFGPHLQQNCMKIQNLGYTYLNGTLVFNLNASINSNETIFCTLTDIQNKAWITVQLTTNKTGVYKISGNIPIGIYFLSFTSSVCGVIITPYEVNLTDENTILIYYGWLSNLSSLDNLPVDIGTLKFIYGITHTDLSIDYRSDTLPNFLYMMEPITEPAKTIWYTSPYNTGTINGFTDLFLYREYTDYRIYYTQYRTQQNDTPIIFKL